MAKAFPIRLQVEEIALGTVLRRLNEMAGIVKIDLDLGHGGRKPLPLPGQPRNGDMQARIVAALMQGRKNVDELSTLFGGAKHRVYGAVHGLKKKKLVRIVGKGVYELTGKAMAELGPHAPPRALPAPLRHGPKGRASPGSGNIILRTVLDGTPMTPHELREVMTAKGMSAKSISGVITRAKKDGLVRKNGSDLYELTAKGQKIELSAEAAHG